jgi:hypothetical protein
VLRPLGDGLEAGATETVHCQRWSVDRQAAPQSDMAGEVDGIGRSLEHVAEDHVAYCFRLDPTALHRGASGMDTEVSCGVVLQSSAEGAEARSHPGKEDDVCAGAHVRYPGE